MVFGMPRNGECPTLTTAEITFPKPDPDEALAPLRAAVSAKGFAHCIYLYCGMITAPGVLRCEKHHTSCIDPDCRSTRKLTFDREKDDSSLRDASGAELLCDHCRGYFFEKLVRADNRAYRKTGIRREFFVYR